MTTINKNDNVITSVLLFLGAAGIYASCGEMGNTRSRAKKSESSKSNKCSKSVMGSDKFPCTVSVDKECLKKALPEAKLIGSIDQGTSSTRFLVFTQNGDIAVSCQMEHTQIFPSDGDKVGWHEHDPIEIWQNTVTCMRLAVDALSSALSELSGTRPWPSPLLEGIGITNQRETTIAWNAESGVPYHNAIVWDDPRTAGIAASVADGDADRLRAATGLPLASYFAGTKVRWLVENVHALREDLLDGGRRGQVRFGTVDTWLVYQLTGCPPADPQRGAANAGGSFVTDVSNASRWLFLDIGTLRWDPGLVQALFQGSPCFSASSAHQFPVSTALPQVLPSSQVYAACHAAFGVEALAGVPIAGILGDQQAALFGQVAFQPGEAKNTYGTGMFLMMNTGQQPIHSNSGMLTTVAYQLGSAAHQDPNADAARPANVVYALEGSVSHSGSTIQWLRDQLQIIRDAKESETLAAQTTSNDGLYFVPAFAGLFAPYWKSDARGCIVGMTATHTRAHISRAALESTAYQARDVFDAIHADSSVSLTTLRVDGGGTANRLLMQFQADMLGVPVVKPVVRETTALGAAFVAGLAVGVWDGLEQLKGLWREEERFCPDMEQKVRDKYWKGWKKAVTKSMGWVDDDNDENKE